MKTVNTTNNTELQVVVDLLVSRVVELLAAPTDRVVEVIHHDNESNKAQTAAVIDMLKSSDSTKVFTFIAKHIIMSAVKEVPRTVLITQIAELYHSSMSPTTRFRMAQVLVKLFELTDAFTSMKKMNVHCHQEYVVVLKQKLTKATIEELQTSVWKLPKSVPTHTSSKAGHFKKISADNSHMMDITMKLDNVAYTLDERVWNKFKYDLAAYRFTDMPVQHAFITNGDHLVGKTFYFTHRFGDDNGRIYCDGDLFTLQGGALNYVYKFADKRVLTAEGMKALRTHVDELHHKASLSFKESVELYSLTLDLIDAEAGLPVGTILHKDAKLSGLQHQAIATRSIHLAKFCGMIEDYSDGYTHIRSSLSNSDQLSRDMVKKAFNPYQYGAGSSATITPVLEAGGHIDYKEWEAAYAKAFPEAFNLRSFLLLLSKQYASDTFTFTSPSGFNCTVTALGTVDTAISGVYGKLQYIRKEIDKEHMGVKLVAAFSHMQDAAVLHSVVRKSKYDMHVVHDSFGAHPNDIADVLSNYVWALREHLAMPILKQFVQEVLKSDEAFAVANVSKYISNTLTPSDIVGGLF